MMEYIKVIITIALEVKSAITEKHIRETQEKKIIEQELKDGLVYLSTLKRAETLIEGESVEEYKYKKVTNRVNVIGKMISIEDLSIKVQGESTYYIMIKIKIYKKREKIEILEKKETKTEKIKLNKELKKYFSMEKSELCEISDNPLRVISLYKYAKKIFSGDTLEDGGAKTGDCPASVFQINY